MAWVEVAVVVVMAAMSFLQVFKMFYVAWLYHLSDVDCVCLKYVMCLGSVTNNR